MTKKIENQENIPKKHQKSEKQLFKFQMFFSGKKSEKVLEKKTFFYFFCLKKIKIKNKKNK
jgi:hypothetical protein